MRLDNRTRIAVSALIGLMWAKQKPTTLQQLSTLLNVSLSYIEQIFANLRAAGLVSAERGPGGGYQLAKAAREITIASIAQAVAQRSARRITTGNAVLDESWRALNQRSREFLEGITLDACAQAPNG